MSKVKALNSASASQGSVIKCFNYTYLTHMILTHVLPHN